METTKISEAQREQQIFANGMRRSFNQMMRIINGEEKGENIHDFLKELKEEI